MKQANESKQTGAEKKRILALYYSQSGQLTGALRSMMEPLCGRDDVEVVFEELRPKEPYPFPWPVLDFMDVFPESVYMDPPEMCPVSFDPDDRYDLVVLAYQVWFLSPSLPVTGFLNSEAARVLRGRPVVTLIACRNMWLSAHEKVKRALDALGAELIDNVVLVDQGPPWATFVTTPRWLWTGKKNAFWVFPPAGVSPVDIYGASRFGRALAGSVERLGERPAASLLNGLGAVKVNPRYIAGEKIAHKSFVFWGGLFRRLGRRGARLRRTLLPVYLAFIVLMILTVLPVSMVLRAVLYPVLSARLKEGARRFEEPSGSSTERMAEYP